MYFCLLKQKLRSCCIKGDSYRLKGVLCQEKARTSKNMV